MTTLSRHVEGRRPVTEWWVDAIFWVSVAALLLAGAFFLRHDFSPCDPTYETCAAD
jgi:hypothetical protein